MFFTFSENLTFLGAKTGTIQIFVLSYSNVYQNEE